MNDPHPLLNRRDFLKLAGLLSMSAAFPHFVLEAGDPQGAASKENVLIVVFDAFSGHNLSLYGYPRDTTPNINRLADSAIVFHNHHSAGNFTTPGTASLLTGALPWTHRAVRTNDTVAEPYVDRNAFSAFSGYHRMAYSHNPLVVTLLDQFFSHVDDLTPLSLLFLDSDEFITSLFKADEDTATVSWVRAIKQLEDGYSYSLFFSRLYEAYKAGRVRDIKDSFPRGLPNINTDNFFILEQGIDWLHAQMAAAPKPFFSYYHFLPPHFPYKTRVEFVNSFVGDDYRHPLKPSNIFSKSRTPEEQLLWRDLYDEFILYVDEEFARLYNLMEAEGLLENTWLVFTSDHGEMFDRGVTGHGTPLLYGPLIHVPLLIFPPGGAARQDVYSPTSAIDVLPTLLHLTGQQVPAWLEGDLLPPFNTSTAERDAFAMQAKGIDKDDPISKATAMLVRGRYKLVYFFGYAALGEQREMIELYDLEADPQESNNLYPSQKAIADELLTELKRRLHASGPS